MNEKYIPSKEEIELAEEIAVEDHMTSEQKSDSEFRVKNWEQEQAPWVPFDDDDIDENFERKPATPEQKEDMDRRLAELADAFEGSDINWHMDGALNVSLMNGGYIGNHKDVDLSIEKNELAKLEAQLLKKGFGLFLSRTEDKTKNKVMRRAGHADFADSDTEHMLIAAIDENGQIRRDKSLNFVDTHIVERNADGQALGNSGVVIPDKWTKPYPVEFQGKSINLSHPGKVLYYKLHQGRGYDTTDIQRLVETGKVTEEDVADVEKVFESEFTANIVRGRKVFEAVAKQLMPEMNTDQIIDVILQQRELTKGGEEAREFFRPFAQKIFESDDKTTDAMLKIGIELFKVEEKDNQKREEINRVRQAVVDAQKLKQIREELKK
ncbi:hypothetical protein A3I34_02575 [Candidatus Jorgensenbacteria bacterium RIFCSPLOWO2_02_FULL_45_12]|uniref:Uncharacterized protein n=2 Tax=Candidatus Joergenseniibacteriota TaxID=1752739 RepID=A0A1F6BQT1_9BACT|nr:MAG: hypothetical protein UX22_C0007G0032 [Candidatus Jorgensenbacteria bacterium GW2011_GWA2_45_9]OGG39285.1 MAG: hypothetical protein A3D55_02700 [Candidatus Jorgensenbacteria bacterium RIFCSPHIGHO2_02_FULL_45_20]OGG42766.1 MAG: hypothetical protein A3I34_02575 [Candidatus Jorgensenbacteria bacterium RIFCSPLOWO2_02_FULL_45_12]